MVGCGSGVAPSTGGPGAGATSGSAGDSKGAMGGSATGGAAGSAGSPGTDAGYDAPRETGSTAACNHGGTPPFQFNPSPNAGEPFDSWPVRTVDDQKVADVLRSWRLKLDGMVETPQTLSFYEMLCLQRQDEIVDFHCVEGWSILDVPWNGLHLSILFALAKPLSTATHVTFHTMGGKYNESLPLDVALEPKTLLAYGVNGSSLPLARGFPARLVVPRLLAYKSAKYVERIELTDHPVEGFWVAAGYDYDAEVPPNRLRSGKY